MQMRRFTRLTNAFSKKIENHEAAIALHYMHYNFARVHQTLGVRKRELQITFGQSVRLLICCLDFGARSGFGSMLWNHYLIK
jgi:hypothetical protein